MAITSKVDLINKFKNGAKPSEIEFADLIDSCYGFVDAIAFDTVTNVISLTVPDVEERTTKVITIDLKKLDQTLVYDETTNLLRITGHFDLPQKMGYWGPRENLRHKVDQISADARVGIKTPNPEADLDVNGSFMLRYGKSVNEISSTLETENFKQALPTVEAIFNGMQEYPTLMLAATLFKYDDGPQRVGDNAFRFLDVQHLHVSGTFDGTSFRIPTNGLYKVDLSFRVKEYSMTANGEAYIYILRTSQISGQTGSQNVQYAWKKKGNMSGKEEYITFSVTLSLFQADKIEIHSFLGADCLLDIDGGALFNNSIAITRLVVHQNSIALSAGLG
jgi:hypothetical protein